MKATMMYQAGDVRVVNVPDAAIIEPTDAVIRITLACICGSDLWPYKELAPTPAGRPMGHEAIGVIEEIGVGVKRLRCGDLVVMPFAFSDGSCDFCQEGLQTACSHGGFFGVGTVGCAQAEAVRVPQADGTLYKLPVREDDALMPSLLTLSDVMGTGHHAAVVAHVSHGKHVAVIGDGAVGLCGVIAARRLGAQQIILLGHHPDRIKLGKEFGATDIVRERGEAAVEQVRALTGGVGAHCVLECVGTEESMRTAVRICRAGGAIGRVGVPHYEATPASLQAFYGNVSVCGGPAPVRAYVETLLLDILEGRIQPGKVFDRTVKLEEVPAGYSAMNQRQSLKVLIRP
jgi:threonine dehydrogenase-like Zn-dependent dehydrogenase